MRKQKNNDAKTNCNEKPGAFARQPPLITRGSLGFCLAIHLCGVLDDSRMHGSYHFVIVRLFVNCPPYNSTRCIRNTSQSSLHTLHFTFQPAHSKTV